jgi:exodeoxyribonuclease VII small subunit
MPKTKTAPKPVEDLTYEEALAELEGIAQALEEEQNPLEESMTLFARGQALTARCNALLEAAQLQVQKLTGDTLSDFEENPE